VKPPLRRGSTVRCPVRENTAFVQRVLHHLEDAGATWAPRALGIDEQGLEVVSWIPGETATTGEQVDVLALAQIVRDLHDLTADLVDGSECVIHDDLQPRNTVVRGGRPIGLIDWEQARPGRRVDDVAHLCWSFIEPTAESDPSEIGRRWRLVIDAYALDDRSLVVPTVLSRMDTCAEDIEREAARGSTRHEALAERGDHLGIRAMHRWVAENERLLQAALAAG
jgi:tRNA A-37 threonylcarbamoyl transferase component Bud32